MNHYPLLLTYRVFFFFKQNKPCFQVPPTGKGSLYIRPLLMGSGAVLGHAPAPEYKFIIFVSPVGNYFKVRVEFPLISTKFCLHPFLLRREWYMLV